MRERLRLDLRIATIARSLLHGLLYAGLVLAAVILMMLGEANHAMMERVRIAVAGAVTPVLEIIARPVDLAVVAAQSVQGWQALRAENQSLAEERAHLLHWQETANRLEAENANLRELLHLVPDPPARFVTARVIADSGGAFARGLIVGAGANDGVAKGHAVLNGAGLIGRVAAVAPRSALVLLITDINFKAPVMIGASRVRAILAGDNSDRPRIIHLDPDTFIAAGDRVVTSGHAGAFPADLPVGTIATVGDGAIRIHLAAAKAPVDYLRIVDYGLKGIIDDVLSPPAQGAGLAGFRADASGTVPMDMASKITPTDAAPAIALPQKAAAGER